MAEVNSYIPHSGDHNNQMVQLDKVREEDMMNDLLALPRISIQDLPNILLMHIFSYLEVKERIRSELVCRRWRLIVKELPWKNPTKLVFIRDASKSSLNMPVHQLSDDILRAILSRCGSCLKTLVLKTIKSMKFPVRLTRVSIYTIAKWCPNLESINLRMPVNSTCVKVLSNRCSKLREVKIVNSGYEETAEGLKTLVEQCRYLERFTISKENLTCNWFTVVNPKLKVLSLENCELSELSVRNLTKQCDALQELNLNYWLRVRLSERILFLLLDPLKEMLKVLALRDVKWPKNINWCHILRGLYYVEDLVISFCECVTDEVMYMLAKESPNLRSLDISNSEITDSGLASLASLSRLKIINASYTRITGMGLKTLAARGRLEEVILHHTLEMTEENCCYLAKSCPNLRVLDVCGTKQISTYLIDAFCDAFKSGFLSGPVSLLVEGTSIPYDAPTCAGLDVCFPIFVPRIISRDHVELVIHLASMTDDLCWVNFYPFLTV